MNLDTTYYKILKKISDGNKISNSELFPFIGSENKHDRLYYNLMLSNTFYELEDDHSHELAYECIKRAWLLSNFDERLLVQFYNISQLVKKTDDIAEAYKQLGLSKLSERNLNSSLEYFNKWHNIEAAINKEDKYKYDFDILNAIDSYTESQKFTYTNNPSITKSTKIKLGFLIEGITVVNSVLLKINLIFAKYYNKEKFELSFYTPKTINEIKDSPQGAETISLIESYGCNIFSAKEELGYEERLKSVANNIFNDKIEILVTSAALADFEHYFITSFKPSPIIIGLAQGPPPQFLSINHMDWAISWTKHPILDSPVNCYHIPLEMDFSNFKKVEVDAKEELGIPETGIILMSGGRPAKFQNKLFWRSISKLLQDNTNLYFVAVGTTKELITDNEKIILPIIKDRIKFLGWRENYLEILSIADIMIDTYPNGGGVFLLEAMNLGIPVFTYENNYMKEFDQTDWSPISEFISIEDLICERGDFNQLMNRTEVLIQNENYRKDLGTKCKMHIRENFGKPERMVKRLENKYLEIIEYKENEKIKSVNQIQRDPIADFLEYHNFKVWQKAYINGYNSSMGNHRNYFYDEHLQNIGLYEAIDESNNIIEFAPGDASFIKQFIEFFPNKEFSLVDISEENIKKVQNTLEKFPNVKTHLNFPEIKSFQNIDLVFSFLLCQSMPRSLWLSHLETVFNMLKKDGSYFFQFAYKNNESSNDSIESAISGSNKYSANEIAEMLEKIGFSGCDLTVPITLEKFESDIVWYICKAIK
ncbi:MAG: glycosyltransferase [Ignavibacteriae bacterium]|nr:glycosyltransferase [Ignavibacteriota bacterium]